MTHYPRPSALAWRVMLRMLTSYRFSMHVSPYPRQATFIANSIYMVGKGKG